MFDHISVAMKQWREAAEKMQSAVCQAVSLLNRSPEVARSTEGREAHMILRKALSDYADDYMDQPVTEAERETIARKHRKA